MRRFLGGAVLWLALAGPAVATEVNVNSRHGTLGIDMHYLMMPKEARQFTAVPGSARLEEIINLGARALDWVDLLQKDIPVSEREQVWRRIDRVGREPTPDNPMYYNERIILEQFDKVIAKTPKVLLEILHGSQALPATPPNGFTIKDVVDHIRDIHTLYSRTSRWLVLYDWRFSLNKENRDFRGVLKVLNKRERLREFVSSWTSQSEAERAEFVSYVSESCPMTTRDSVERCRRKYAHLVKAANGGQLASKWLEEQVARSQRALNSRFGVQATHFGVRLSTDNSGFRLIEMPTYGIESDVFEWIQDRVNEAWVFTGSIGVKLFATSGYTRGAVKVRWEKGALPNVNGIAGDVITMDSNTPKWLDHTQTVMRHEMGHVLGFTDCYTEFWDEELEAFTYYSLDPSDAMCALSGEYLDRHRDALIKGYFNK